MKINFLLSLVTVAILSAYTADSQISRGSLKQGLTVDSKILARPVPYSIYLPAHYETSIESYPVLYLLHGYAEDEKAWARDGSVHLIADEAIAGKTISPMILVMPYGGVTRYINNYDNSVRYEDFFLQEFIPYIESKYRVKSQKRFRAIGGNSMGAAGALVLVLRHTDMFAACLVLSPGFRTEEEYANATDAEYNIVAHIYGQGLKGTERLTHHWRSYNPYYIIRSIEPDKLKGVRLYIDCGTRDPVFKTSATFHKVLSDLSIPHEYRPRDGGHDWNYWREGLPEALRFVSNAFAK